MRTHRNLDRFQWCYRCSEKMRGSSLRTLSIHPKHLEVSKYGAKISVLKFSENLKVVKISEIQPTQPKISEIPWRKSNGHEIESKKLILRTFGYSSRGCPLFRKRQKMLSHSSLEIKCLEIQTGIFNLLNRKRSNWFITH